ncbi:MAG: CopG family transcriptional regulator [Thermoanaerobaculia bacterium]
MKRTTIYLTDDLKRAVEAAAEREKRTEADVIRDAIAASIEERRPPDPRVPLTGRNLGDETIAERVDDLLEDFGR